MDEIARERVLMDFISWETRQYKPFERALQVQEEEQERKEDSARLAALFANESDCEELALTLYDLIREWTIITHCRGMRRGYQIAEGLTKLEEKGKPKHKVTAKIMRVLMKDPKASTEKVFRALDKAHIPLYKSKTMPKDGLRWEDMFWEDVVTEPYYKNLVSRVRKQVARDADLRKWQKAMAKVDKDWGPERLDFS